MDVDGANFHAVAPGLGDDDVRRVEAHRLVPQQGGEEGGGVIAAQPGGLVGEHGEGGGVAFGEGVAAEGLQLREDLLGDGFGHVAGDCPIDKPLMELGHGFGTAFVTQCAPELLPLAWCESRQIPRDFEHLLLEDDHAQRLC